MIVKGTQYCAIFYTCSIVQNECQIFKYYALLFAGTNRLNRLSELYKFITGCKRIPPLGLPKRITVKFKHGCVERCRCRPTASTCDISITLPVHYHDNYSQFKEYITSALIEGKGLGLS